MILMYSVCWLPKTVGTELNNNRDVSLCWGCGELAESNRNLRNSGHKLLPGKQKKLLKYWYNQSEDGLKTGVLPGGYWGPCGNQARGWGCELVLGVV